MNEDKTVITSSDITKPASLKPTDACLVEIYGTNLGKRYPLYGRNIIIGRDDACAIVVPKDNVSRYHAKLTKIDDDRFAIEDLESTNGTFINDNEISEAILNNGDLIRVGGTIFKYISGSDIEAGYYAAIYRMTIIDGLTDIYNKRYFMENLSREMGRSQRYNRPLSIMIIDIDHFKRVNDNYGHIAGDFVLRFMCQTINQYVRQEEVFARYGGEEFAIMLPERTIDKARIFAEKIRENIQKTVFEFEGNKLPITLSIGVAQLNNEASPEEFIATADAWLYEAKNSGRNKVCSPQDRI